MKKQVLIIGGGASGLTAGIMAAREGASVTILEHMDRVGKKILSTGNGRCNMTNLSIRPDCYRSSQKRFPMQVLDRFSVWDTLTFFDELGIVTKNKNGYIYPNSEQAAAVCDALRLEALHQGIRIVTGCSPTRIRAASGRFVVESNQGRWTGEALILATGSKAAPSTGSDGSGYRLAASLGHTLIEPLPALVQLRCRGSFFKQLAGVRCEAAVQLYSDGKLLAKDQGELQLTDYGVSGIPIFQVSRFASVALHRKRPVTVQIDFLPSKTLEETRRFLKERAIRLADRSSCDFLTGVLNKKLAAVLEKQAGISQSMPVSALSVQTLERLAGLMKKFEVEVTETNSFAQAQICCGGVDTRQICPDTLESRLVSGLYFAGELIDVDGICGGYNLQWAWSSGAVAGQCAGKQDRCLRNKRQAGTGNEDI